HHHDALRLRVWRDGSEWRQEILDPREVQPALRQIDLSAIERDRRAEFIGAHAGGAQSSLSLAEGCVSQIVLFDAGDEQRLLLVIHHMAVDGVSWRVILEDLRAAYRQLEAGQEVKLPSKTASVKSWGEALQR